MVCLFHVALHTSYQDSFSKNLTSLRNLEAAVIQLAFYEIALLQLVYHAVEGMLDSPRKLKDHLDEKM